MLTKAEIEKYFTAEKSESLLFLVIGIIAILLAIAFFFFLKTSFYKGAAVPLLVIGIIQAVVGFTVYARSDGDRIRNVYSYDMDPGRIKNEELPRMEKVNRNFLIYRWVEIVLAIAGIVMIVKFRNQPDSSFLYGLGITLAIQAILMLGADYFAEKRAIAYTKQIVEWKTK